MASKRKPVRQCKVTPEGWVYIVIVCFIAVGAILRNVNLLILATGMLLAPLIFNWRVCVVNLRSLSAKRVVPERVHAQTPVNVSWTCSNIGGRLTARNLILNDRLRRTRKPELGKGFFGRVVQSIVAKFEAAFRTRNLDDDYAHVCFRSVSTMDPGIVTYQCFFPGRGKYDLGPAELRTSYPFGLVACSIPLPQKDTVYVAPPLGVLHPTWERRINSMETGGQSQMRRRGMEQDEFYAMRKWRSGDSRRNIHWRSTARLGHPMVKQFDEPNDRDFALLLDLHHEDEATRLQCETILSFAATALSQVGSEVQGQLAVAVCGEENHLVCGRQSRATHNSVMRRLAVAHPTENPDIDASVVEVAGQISMGTPLYCFSTRDKPVWLTSNESVEVSPALSSVRQLVRWVRVGSKEFTELYSIEGQSSAVSRVAESVTSAKEVVA
ncbi:DUF58 domain-containing protein [Mariniblastus fucicola]|uniref:DUF58 domain-containing protein n=1 Tax=Mariniblastus fucicola TaxID=980251 RepID=A0A5B9PGV3_9BACT|nr:DUF58 domain-containing protein [Mariniblastus fucicola]QEG24465.1 hypothetical protein MFFC18_43850 [Mariniblastus fucicola]